MAAPDLVNPVFYSELENIQLHSKFFIDQLQRMREALQLERNIAKKDVATVEENADITKLLQTEILGILRELDDSTKKLQVLVGLPSVESDKIELNKLEVSKLSTNPLLPEKYGILDRLPKVIILGGHSMELSPTKGLADDDGEEGENRALQSLDFLTQEKQLETKTQLLNNLQPKLQAKAARLEGLITENRILRNAIKLLPPNRDAIERAFHTGYPQNESEVNELIKDLAKEIMKIAKLIEKTECEIREQHRANELILSERKATNSLGSANQKDPVFDLDTENGINKESLSLKELKQLFEKLCEQVRHMKESVEELSFDGEKCKHELEKASEKLKLLHEIADEKLKVPELLVELKTVTEALERLKNYLEDLNRQEDYLRDVLSSQDTELRNNEDAFFEAQEKHEEGRLRNLQKEQEYRTKAECTRLEIDSFSKKIESKLNVYRALPFVLATTKTQCSYLEEQIRALKQDCTLLSKELTFFEDKVEELLRTRDKEKGKAAHCDAKRNKAAQLRDMYDAKELRMNQLRQTIQTLNGDLTHINTQSSDKQHEIETLQQTIESLKEEYAVKLVNLKDNHEKKKLAQLKTLEVLERKLAVERARQRVVLEDPLWAVEKYCPNICQNLDMSV